MDSDWGMPGNTPESRASATIAALFAFLSQDDASDSGAFRSHVARLVAFLKSLSGLDPDRQKMMDAVLDLARNGRAPEGDWLAIASRAEDHWKEIEVALTRS